MGKSKQKRHFHPAHPVETVNQSIKKKSNVVGYAGSF